MRSVVAPPEKIERPVAPAPARRRSRAPLWAALGTLGVILLALVVLLSQSDNRLAGTNSARFITYPIGLTSFHEVCQEGEDIPADAAALRLVVGTNRLPGPPLTVRAGGERIRVPGGYAQGPLRVPLSGRTTGFTTVCVRNDGNIPVWLGGQDARMELPQGLVVRIDGNVVPVAARFEYRRAGEETWWSIAPEIMRRWGRSTALGAATPWIAIALFLAAFGGAIALAVRGRATAPAVAAVATLAAAGWAFTTPAFHVPDEPQHFAYAQYLAETGKLPRPMPGKVFSNEESVAFVGVRANLVFGEERGRPPWTADADERLDRALAADPGRMPDGAASNATNNPPLFYLAASGPYWAATAAGGDFFDRLLALRLLSALLTGLTAAFAFLFVREVLPRRPWAWTAGALAFAVQPLLGFVGGGFNNDVGLYTAAAAILWLVARAVRRGLDTRTAVAVGLAVGLCLVTKATILGFAPALGLAALVVVARAAPSERRAAIARVGLAAGIAAVPVVAYLILNNTVWERPVWAGAGTATTTAAGRPMQLAEFFSRLWQFYLPRLPFMQDHYTGMPVNTAWFEGFVGRYGWVDTVFPDWVYWIARALYAGVAALAIAALWRARRVLRTRAGLIVVLATLVGGYLFFIAYAGYRYWVDTGYAFEQARYLLPLGALIAAGLALAVRGAGRRWGPAVGAALVTLAVGHALFSALLVIGRFYA
jgi:hypothetical protein